jgi:hypothetical protein
MDPRARCFLGAFWVLWLVWSALAAAPTECDLIRDGKRGQARCWDFSKPLEIHLPHREPWTIRQRGRKLRPSSCVAGTSIPWMRGHRPRFTPLARRMLRWSISQPLPDEMSGSREASLTISVPSAKRRPTAQHKESSSRALKILRLRRTLAEIITSQQTTNGLPILPVQLAHALALENLPKHHKDPFDRLLVDSTC